MHIEKIFVSFVATEQLNLPNNTEIKNCCLDYIEKYSVKSKPNQVDITRNDKNFKSLFEVVEQKINEVATSFGITSNSRLEIDNAWVNLNRVIHTQVAHCHPGYMFSAVYYPLATPNTDWLEFTNPITAHQYVFSFDKTKIFNDLTASSWKITPETGQLIIFPSWLIHQVRGPVYAQPNSDNRISIAFNSKLMDKFI
jgi:uncharacterized protein (TIGR02466 family)